MNPNDRAWMSEVLVGEIAEAVVARLQESPAEDKPAPAKKRGPPAAKGATTFAVGQQVAVLVAPDEASAADWLEGTITGFDKEGYEVALSDGDTVVVPEEFVSDPFDEERMLSIEKAASCSSEDDEEQAVEEEPAEEEEPVEEAPRRGRRPNPPMTEEQQAEKEAAKVLLRKKLLRGVPNYTREKLSEMKRPHLVMLASLLEVKNPLQKAGPLITAILLAQKKRGK